MGAIEAVHRHLLAERERGTAILLISEELDELMSLSDRIVGIYEGQNMGELSAEEATLGEIGLMMAGTPHASSRSEPWQQSEGIQGEAADSTCRSACASNDA